LEKVKEIIKADVGDESFKIGKLIKEKQLGDFVGKFEQFIDGQTKDATDLGALVQESLCVKEAEELEYVKKAGGIAVWFQNKLISEIEDIIDNESQSKHADISAKIESLLDKENEMKALENSQHVDRQFVDLCYAPIV